MNKHVGRRMTFSFELIFDLVIQKKTVT